MAKKCWLQLIALGLALLLMGTAAPLRAFGDEPPTGVSDTDADADTDGDALGLSAMELAALWQQPCSIQASISMDANLVAKGDPMVTLRLERLDALGRVAWTDYQTVRMSGGSTFEQPYWNSWNRLGPGVYRLSLLPVLRYRISGITELAGGIRLGNTVLFSLGGLSGGPANGTVRFSLHLEVREWMSDTDRMTNITVPIRHGGGCYDDGDE